MHEPDGQLLRILIVDDHFFVRIGLSHVISDEDDMQVVAHADSGRTALERFQEHKPDIVLMDMSLLDTTGDVVLNQMQQLNPTVQCILFSVSICEEDVYRGVQAGAAAYLPKSMERSELVQAIRTVANGGKCYPPMIQEILERRENRRELTPREQETLQYLVNGLSNKEIAKAMSISSATVKLHISHLYEKLGVEDRTQAVAEAIVRGLTKPH